VNNRRLHSAIAGTFAGRVHVKWDATAPVTPFGQLPFFIDYLKQAGLFDAWVADCSLSLISPNASKKRDLLGAVLLSVLAGHRRYAHITALRCDRLPSWRLSPRRAQTGHKVDLATNPETLRRHTYDAGAQFRCGWVWAT
jgi:hypothetical protein